MAETTIKNGVTCLEDRGKEARHEEIVRNEYNKDNQYGVNHPNALSDGDEKGKGTGGSHTHWLPNCQGPKGLFDYSNFNTMTAGGLYDIEGRAGHPGRKQMIVRSLYNAEMPYGTALVNTAENIAEGQVHLNY